MLGETLIQRIESNLDNIENSKPSGFTSHHAGAGLNKTRQALLKKGGRRVRSSPTGLRHHHCPQQHPKHPGLLRSNPTRFIDINNNTVVAGSKPPVPSNTETAAAARTQTTVLTLHHLKQGAKKELLKTKTGRGEKVPQPGGLVHSFNKHEHTSQNLNARCQSKKHNNALGSAPSGKRNDNSCHLKPSSPHELYCRGGKKPLNLAGNVNIVNVSPSEPPTEEDDDLKDGEKTYAGAKFSEPPSPSVLPKPPSHWMGEKAPVHSDNSREQMTVHLKTLLKVQAKP
ncbi:hypothetical protein SKAU_G00188600 [Synaphobranchus kaupii]|uniref:Proline-rich nuclear receptor coactivator 1 n=1 Tax=Synaphobranchus kaupii TaxID=118154 RepID=A0A9Q1IWN1_SYNKA|nr:hypothetical protein SKAU_G00188600 [Synaphobranchus kaupii]